MHQCISFHHFSSRFGSLVRRASGWPAADLEALADTLVRVSHLAMHIEGHLAELDINPLMVLPSGQGVKAVDALVVLRGT
ncbi:MAG: acetate--CoA ligase family protein [Stellaceae bacterium]